MHPRRSTIVAAAALAVAGLSVMGPVGPDRAAAMSAAPSSGGRAGDSSARELASAVTPRPTRRRPALCALPPREEKLPPATLRGLAHHLHQYPEPSLATTTQRKATERLVTDLIDVTRKWRNPRRAAAAGYVTRRARRAGSRSVGFLHAEHRRYSHDDRYLDPRRPETLVYASVPGRPLVLIGVMFSMPRGLSGPTPGGPITRWHWHVVCARGDERGLTPLPDGSCPRGTTRRQGSEMMHVWFTGDLRSAFAIHAPVPDLCAARLLPPDHCR
jgi:hypothetical protein